MKKVFFVFWTEKTTPGEIKHCHYESENLAQDACGELAQDEAVIKSSVGYTHANVFVKEKLNMPTATMHTITTHILTWINSNERHKVNSLSFESDRLANDAKIELCRDANVLPRTVQITPIQTQVIIPQSKFDWAQYKENPDKFDVFLNGNPVNILSDTIPGKYSLLVTSNDAPEPYSRLLPKDSDMLTMSEKQHSDQTRKTLSILVRKTPHGYYSAVAYSTPCEITRVINTLEPGEEYRVANVTF